MGSPSDLLRSMGHSGKPRGQPKSPIDGAQNMVKIKLRYSGPWNSGQKCAEQSFIK